jgi:hypothetical protein
LEQEVEEVLLLALEEVLVIQQQHFQIQLQEVSLIADIIHQDLDQEIHKTMLEAQQQTALLLNLAAAAAALVELEGLEH